jgi:RimJ/RimL family protein N-acetyltransferase
MILISFISISATRASLNSCWTNLRLSDISQAREIIEFYQQPEGKAWNRWGISLKSSGQLVGTCGFHKWNKHDLHAEIGYDLNPEFWGQGIMTKRFAQPFKTDLKEWD